MDQISSIDWGSASGRKTLIFHSLNQPREHALDFTDAGVESLLLLPRNEPQVARKQQKVFQFARRPKRSVEELPKFRLPRPPTTFGDICRDGCCGPSHLTCQAVPLRFRKGGRRRVDSQDERMAALPYFQLSVVLHGSDNQLSIFSSYLQQKTAGASKKQVSAQILRVGVGQTKMSICLPQLNTDNRQPLPALRADGVLPDANNQPNTFFSYGQLKTDNCQPFRGASC